MADVVQVRALENLDAAEASAAGTEASADPADRRRHDAVAWDRYVADTRPEHIVYIDITGTCNLKCPSCAVGNSAQQFPKSLMSLQLFERILDKIEREHAGERVDIELYIWGEPVMHKQLAKFIALTKSRGMSVGISCNMNLFPKMPEVVAAAPTFIRISLSGFTNATYQQAHAGGDIDAVKGNMYRLRQLIDETGSKTIVQVFYHLYKHNFGDDFDAMRRLCAELDFLFQPYAASLRPVEKTIEAMRGNVADADRAIVDKFVVSMPDASHLAQSARAAFPDCEFKRSTFITTNGAVRLCGVSFDNDHIVADSFLDTPRETIRARRAEHDFCETCQALGADLVLSGAIQQQIHALAVETLGQKWSDYMAGR